MCGRYALYGPVSRLRAQFDAREETFEFTPRYNAAPMQWLPVVRQRADGGRVIDLLRWGLVPSWATDETIATRLINARGETLAHKPAFRSAFHKRRCIVPVNGFYQWTPVAGGKQPYYIHPPDDALLGLAGLWEHWTRPADGERVDTFTIITAEAGAQLRPLHDRTPVILAPEHYGPWLARDTAAESLAHIVGRPDPGGLVLDPVSKAVGNVRNDGAELIVPRDGR